MITFIEFLFAHKDWTYFELLNGKEAIQRAKGPIGKGLTALPFKSTDTVTMRILMNAYLSYQLKQPGEQEVEVGFLLAQLEAVSKHVTRITSINDNIQLLPPA